MAIFGLTLAEVEQRLLENTQKTKATFPEEIQLIEFGLTLMRNITQITQEVSKEYPRKPNLYANHNLFARNRQLLLNAHICLLNSSYGTQFVLMRTVLENNNLMRLFNKNPQYAFEWLPEDQQKQFTKEIQLEYGKLAKHDISYHPSSVRNLIYEDIEKVKVKNDIKKFYDELCNYTHPNFAGWHELVGQKGDAQIILNMPCFSSINCEKATGIFLFLMQVSFKSFVETFKGNLAGFAYQLEEWQKRFNAIIIRYTD